MIGSVSRSKTPAVGFRPSGWLTSSTRGLTTKAKGKGSGLVGLTIARQVVASHGGTIRVDNRPGTGAVSTIELPAAQGIHPQVAIAHAENSGRVVDDDRDTCRIMAEVLAAPGREFELASESERAVHLARTEPFDLVICDINLNSSVNGLDALRAFKGANPTVRFCSSVDSAHDRPPLKPS